MGHISSREAQNNFGALLDNVQKAPIIIKRHNRDCAALLSMEEFELYKKAHSGHLQKLRSKVKKQPKKLTQKNLEDLLKDPKIKKSIAMSRKQIREGKYSVVNDEFWDRLEKNVLARIEQNRKNKAKKNKTQKNHVL